MSDYKLEDAWKEYERTGEICNSAEGLLSYATSLGECFRLKEEECKQLQQDKAELVEALKKALSIQNLWLPVVAFSDCPPDNIAEIESLHLMADDFAKLIGKHKCD